MSPAWCAADIVQSGTQRGCIRWSSLADERELDDTGKEEFRALAVVQRLGEDLRSVLAGHGGRDLERPCRATMLKFQKYARPWT